VPQNEWKETVSSCLLLLVSTSQNCPKSSVVNYLIMSVKPTIVLVPGAWHLPDVFDTVRSILTVRGFPSEAPGHPSIGAEPPEKTLNDDIVCLHQLLLRLADEGKEIVLVLHSYGGVVGSGAVEGLSKAEREKNGKEGGVIIIVYMSAFVVPQGKSLKDMLGGQFLPWMKVEVCEI
jgi:hypothetical protein